MHGLIFVSFLEFVGRRYGEHAQETGLGATYQVTESYADEHFNLLLERASTITGTPVAEITREFGVYAATVSFAALYPNYYAVSADTRSFLLAIEDRIHELVRATIPGAYPPRLNIRPLGVAGLCITYTSERGLCELVEGLVVGTSRHYGEAFDVEEAMCMKRGDLACVFLVQPAGAT